MTKTNIFLLTYLGRKFNYNLGAILQAYALQQVLKGLGRISKFIDYNLYTITYNLPHFLYKIKKNIKSSIVNTSSPKLLIFTLLNTLKYGLHEIEDYYYCKARVLSISNFKQRRLKFTEVSFSDLKELQRHYNHTTDQTFIVGSDVVWSPRFNDAKVLKVYLLGFTHNGIKASYAASVGDPIPHHLRPIYKKYLKEFNFVSVREGCSAKYLLDVLPSLEVEVVLDPTALLSKEEWLKIAKPPEKIPRDPYILVYDIYRSEEILPFVLKFAKKHRLKVLSYSHSLLQRMKGVETFYPYGPQEFIWLINNAKFIVTSSFHGTVFSTIFQKPFVSINPEPYAPVTRIRDYLDLIGAGDRLLDDPAMITTLDFENIEWKTINENLNFHKKRSINYLKKIVEGV